MPVEMLRESRGKCSIRSDNYDHEVAVAPLYYCNSCVNRVHQATHCNPAILINPTSNRNKQINNTVK